jgi:PhnB protein
MNINTKAIPEGYTTVTPYLIIRGVSDAIRFYEKAFGAAEVRRMEAGGKVLHAELRSETLTLCWLMSFRTNGQ